MDIRRARGVALLATAVIAASFGVVVGFSSPVAAAGTAAPTVSLRLANAGSVSVTGRTATARPRVRFYRYAGSGWAFVKGIRAHRHRYATTLSVAAGKKVTFRVTSNHRSRTFVVRMPAAPTPTLYDDCGARPRKADGTAWSCTFHDDFSGTALDRTKWVPQTSFLSGDVSSAVACYVDDSDHVAVGSGMLTLAVTRNQDPEPCSSSADTSNYTAGMISTYHLFSQQYGRFEARIRNTAATAPGLHEAFWLWPDDRVASTAVWPVAGEIDISETYSAYSNLSVPFLHYSADAGGPQPGLNTAWNCTALRGQWNTYTLEWSASRIQIFVNGKTCLINTSGDAAFLKPYIVALTAGLGEGGNALTSSTPVPATMNVDYIRVWH